MAEIGATLREARMRAKVDINEVETRTKIRAKYLRAMENEEWDLLPGEVYVRSFLRTYGEFLGLDPRQLVDEFRRQYENPSDHELPPIAPPSREARERRERELARQQRGGRGRRGGGGGGGGGGPRRGIPSWAIIGVVLVVVVVVLVIVGTRNNSSKHDTSPNAAGVTHHTTHKKHRHKKKKKVHKAPPKPKAVTLAMVPTGDVYVCLVNGKGKVLIPGTIYDTGQTIPSETGRSLLLTLGNSSVTVKANGAAVPVAASTGAIGLKFTPSGHTTLTAAQQPTCT
jgi:cytoskeleton protein RodZ